MTFLILTLATLLRLIFLNQSLWLDEAIQALALMGKMGALTEYALADFQPPLYHFVLLGWTKISGFSELALRTPSLIAGILTVYLVIKFGELIKNKRLGVIAGLLLATNPLHIYYSQEGRTYVMTAFFVTASYYFLLSLLNSKSRPNKLHAVGYVLATIMSLYTSYLVWVAITLQGLYLLLKKEFKLFTLTIVSFLPLIFWIPSFIQQLDLGLTDVTKFPEWGRVVGGFELMRLPRTWIKFIFGRISFVNKTYYSIIAGLAMLNQLLIFSKVKIKKNLFLSSWLFGTILITFAISIFIPVYQYFRLLFVLPAFILLLSCGITKVNNPKNTLLLTLSISLFSLSYFWITPDFHREDWRGLVGYINSNSQENATVALPNLGQSAPLEYYNENLKVIKSSQPLTDFPSNIYYLNYAEDLFDINQTGPKNLENLGYNIKEERVFTGLHLFIYTKEE